MAGFRIGLLLVLSLAMLMVAQSSSPSVNDFQLGIVGHNSTVDGGLLGARVGDLIDPEEEMMMESESARRSLGRNDYISYAALRANNVPCSRRGRSYYNCQRTGQANPYRRGCTVATRCARR